MRLIVGHAVGNDYDIGARLLAKYLQKHIPGQPTIIVQNMTAAQSVVAANYVYAQAPRDGSVIGTFSRNLPNQALMGQSNIEADLRRFNWLGATSLPGRVCAAWHATPVKSVADLLKQELIVGSSGAGTSNSILPTVANHVLGTKFRIIEGYRGSQDVILAVERGEVQGVCATTGQFRGAERLFKEGKLRLLFRSEEAPLPEFPDAPSIFDHVKSDEQRAVHALRLRERRVRPALCLSAGRAERPRRSDAPRAGRGRAGSRSDRGGRQDQARHELSPAGAAWRSCSAT